MRHATILFASIVLFCLNGVAFATDTPEQHPYRYYVTGNPADVQRPTRGLFVLQGGPCPMKPGRVYEINNQKTHSVMNRGKEARISFIFDYFPPKV